MVIFKKLKYIFYKKKESWTGPSGPVRFPLEPDRQLPMELGVGPILPGTGPNRPIRFGLGGSQFGRSDMLAPKKMHGSGESVA